MKGLLIKEYNQLKTTLKAQVFSMILFVALGFVMKNMAYMGMLVMILASNLAVNSMSQDAASSWNRYALTLPVTRSDLISVKFIFLYILQVLGILLIMLIAVPFSVVLKMSLSENILVGAVCGIVTLFCSSLNILMCTKFGVEKARLIMMLTYVVPLLLIYGLYFAVEQAHWIPVETTAHITEKELYGYLTLAAVFILAVSAVCWKLSCAVAKKQDW